MKKIGFFLIIGVVLAATAFLFVKIYPATSKIGASDLRKADPDPTGKFLPSNLDGDWLGIYFQGTKVGYSVTKNTDTPNGHQYESYMSMTMLVNGELKEIKTVAQVSTDREYRIENYSLDLSAQGHSVKARGEISGRTLHIILNTQGIVSEQEVQLDSAPYFHEALEALVSRKKLKSGDSLSIPFFDIATQTQSQAVIRSIGPDQVTIDTRSWPAQKYSVSVQGVLSFLWMSEQGKLLKESSPLGIDMISESREKAIASVKQDELSDIITFFAVRFDTIIPDSRNTMYLQLELSNLDTVDLDLRDDFQRIVSVKPLVVECTSPPINEIPSSFNIGKAETEFLKPSLYVQSDEPDIITTARRIAGKERDKKLIVDRLTNWVYRSLRKQATPSLPSAIDVLKTMEGDCNEHAVLFTALARSLGIPTRIYVGLVNLGDAYYYHAWCAVYLGKWIPVDPTFGEFPADAGHLKLKEGEISEWTKVLKVVGQLKIKVLAYR